MRHPLHVLRLPLAYLQCPLAACLPLAYLPLVQCSLCCLLYERSPLHALPTLPHVCVHPATLKRKSSRKLQPQHRAPQQAPCCSHVTRPSYPPVRATAADCRTAIAPSVMHIRANQLIIWCMYTWEPMPRVFPGGMCCSGRSDFGEVAVCE